MRNRKWYHPPVWVGTPPLIGRDFPLSQGTSQRSLSLRWWGATIFILLLVGLSVLSAQKPTLEELLGKADKYFEDKNYQDASKSYEALLKAEPKYTGWHHASERIIICKLRLQLFDKAIESAEKYITRCQGTPYEARVERLTGNLYMLIPHWGTRAGGKFHRAQWKQGIRVHSYQYDKKHAVTHMERARALYAQYDGDEKALAILPEEERRNWSNERIECSFDLASLCSRFSIYENSWNFWYCFWGERDEFLAETAGERDFDEYYSYWQRQRKRPIGLRVGPDGQPIFPTTPEHYAKELSDDQKILYLLKETCDLDQTENHKYTGLSYYRQAMLARARFGMDRLNNYAGIYYWNNSYPLKKELENYNPWELKDDQALVLVGGQISQVELPSEWNVLELLRLVVGEYAQSGMADEAQYSVGLYYQSRQQYLTALTEYARLKELFPKSTGRADSQISRIKQSQVRISQTGVQLPGEPAKLQLSYRNTAKVWFVARRIDHEKFLVALRAQKVSPGKGMRGFWQLRNWHSSFVNGYHKDNWQHRLAAQCVGEEIARWADEVTDDGTHRYAQVTLQTPLQERGAYLVYAYLTEPPADHAEKDAKDALNLANSRAVFVLTDLAIVEKKVKEGILYFICNAKTGAPVPEAEVKVLEVWSTWSELWRKSIYHKKMHNLTTDLNGFARLNRESGKSGQLHVLVKSDQNRLAWSGMSYWYYYSPSQMKDGLFAYCITDRPVYRPEQTVRFKVWLRRMQNGILQNQPQQHVSITIYDPRGNKIHHVSKQADQYGGLDSEFTLGAEPSLGVYRIYIHGQRYAGGQNFRVEEYKKPEFEVSVEPGKIHTKLGDKITAVIKADYYFGGPVTDAIVKYKVFREEYTHGYYFPGEWDWLYGSGYGFVWYEYPWMPWWGRRLGCWLPPRWWWTGYGMEAPNPVRELVKQGQSPIGSDGTVKVEIDTTSALRDHPDRDHRYVIEAEVRDASRRVIKGSGAIKVTRQAYYAFVQSDRGYYRPGEEMLIRVRCLTPDNKPKQTEGMITISSIIFGGPDNARIEEKELKSWRASTDERGMLEFRLRHEKSGQLKIKFASPDTWDGIVEGYGLVWVCGRDFDGKLYRFNNLEIITDKRTYQPGETAHLMINTQHANSYVLFSDDVDNNHLLSWQLLHLPNKHTVLEIPIKREHQPNFFIEATTVANTRVHQQTKRICVPPEKGVLKLDIATDKPEYEPGEQANVKITARTLEGEPAQVQITLSAFDKSVLYIQSEYTPPIAKFFHGRLRHHYAQMSTNLVEQFSAWGYIHRPFQQLHPYPQAWWGIWGPTVGDWRTVADDELKRMAQGAGFAEKEEGLGLRNGFGPSKSGLVADATAPMMSKSRESGKGKKVAKKPTGPSAPAFAEAEVRQEFADTAAWLTTLTTNVTGTATASFKMPENLTTWKINAWGITKESRVGQCHTSAVTTKNLLVRLQAPRFFMEYDEVVISANVHNYLEKDKMARVSLSYPAELMKMIGEPKATVPIKKFFESTNEIDVEVPADGEVRVDWRVKVIKEGTAKIMIQALTDEESDAMQVTFPVLVHGITKQVATTGSMRPDQTSQTATVELVVPEKRRPELTRLEVQYAPSLVGAMLDALPYCIYYPYGCTEQTMSRFVPCLLTRKTLQNMGIKLEDIKKIRGRMDEVRRIEKGEHLNIYVYNPIFDEAALDTMIKQGLSRIANMQQSDGGWGWWSNDRSSPYLTSYVLYALCTAQACDEAVNENMISRGMNYLRNWEEQEMRHKSWSPSATHAFTAYVLSLKKMKVEYKPPKEDERPGSLIERLYQGRDKLGLYGKALLALAQANLDDVERARIVLRNIMQYKEENEETQVAWFRTPQHGWWYWWNSDIESNAMVLRAIVKLEPKSDVAPKLVKWLLNNRRNGYYWNSTRDTTMCLAAISDFVAASGETVPDYTLTLDLDNGAVVKKIRINKDNFFTYDNRFVVEGVSLEGGKHTLKITKEGPGALYFNTYLSYFTKEEHITAAGHELKIDRTYFKLVQIPYQVEVEGSEGQKIIEKRLRYERVPVKDGDTVKSGDVIQVELKVKSDNDYTYLCLEDMKPAGCEPTALRSGGKGQEGFYSYMELRDEKVVFFVNLISQGEHLLRYRLRAEIPGAFHALPTTFYGMYAPKLRANSEEHLIKIVD